MNPFKNLAFLLFLILSSTIYSQAFKGKGDKKFQVGLNIQKYGTGLNITYDVGAGENISFGLSSTYLLGAKDQLNATFKDLFDLRARFNANIGNVLNISEKLDVYPGLSLGLKNLGGHLGMRYFFTNGFGLYSEFNFPLAKYASDTLTLSEKFHNQFTLSIGASFNL